MMKAATQSGSVTFSAAQTTSFLQTVVILALEMLYAVTAKMWPSPVGLSVSISFHDYNQSPAI